MGIAHLLYGTVPRFHWKNSQAAIHSFVLYYVDTEKETVCHEIFPGISNHVTHDTVAVYTFLLVLINKIIKPRYPFIKKKNLF